MGKYYTLCVCKDINGDYILAYADAYEASAGCLAEVAIAGDKALLEVAGCYHSVSGDCIDLLEDAGLISEITKLYAVQWEAKKEEEK